MTKIKICGLCRNEDIDYVNEYKPDYIGFVFAHSNRQVTKEQARVLRKKLDSSIIPVGVFVNEKMENIIDLVQEKIINVVQLHGDETEEYIKDLRTHIPKTKIIKAVRVSTNEDIIDCENTFADYLLFDSRSLDAYGGTGKAFDWSLIKEIKKPFFLAGGINNDNIEEAIMSLDPFVIDISSAVETQGYKDKNKIKEMIIKTRQLEE